MSWGIVGTGAIAARFAVAAAKAGSPVVAVSSRSQAKGADFAGRFGIAQAVDGAAALAALPQVKAIYLATPNEAHHPDALAVIAAGKAVLCEKPLAVTAAEGREIANAARAAGVFAMEGLWSLCLPVYRTVLDRIAAGEIGEVLEVSGNFSVPQTETAMPRLYSVPGGGALLDRGVYLLALARAILGPLELRHVAGSVTPAGVDLAATLVLENAQGARAVLGCAIDRFGDNRLVIAGSRGRIVVEEPLGNPEGYRLKTLDPNRGFGGPKGLPGAKDKLKSAITDQPRLRYLAKAILQAPKGQAGGLEDQIAHVETCLAAGKTESDWVPLDHSLAGLELIDAARASLGQFGQPDPQGTG